MWVKHWVNKSVQESGSELRSSRATCARGDGAFSSRRERNAGKLARSVLVAPASCWLGSRRDGPGFASTPAGGTPALLSDERSMRWYRPSWKRATWM